MSSLAHLRNARASRDAARRDFDALRGQVQSDLDAQGIGARVADRATEVATDIFVEAIELADRHRGVVGGTIVALTLWFLRNPIISATRAMLGSDNGDDDQKDADDD